jgi:DNA-binding PadR family transcriptional regulator
LTPAAFHVLLGLADGEKHGYAILKDITRRTDGRLKLGVSTLYGALQRLESEGLIRESSARPDPALDDERRRYFRITDFGRDVVCAELRRFEDALSMARAKKLKPSPEVA